MNEKLSSHPASDCPLIPMGAITGSPDRASLTRTLEKWRSVGVTQFMIYARSGCEVEYLSPQYMELCRWICSEAQRLQFSAIWLYDEYNWPSGTCKGKVLRENPQFGAKTLVVTRGKDGELHFDVSVSDRMTDLLSPEAVDCFIHCTHEVYEKHLGNYFGSLVKGFFTDEPTICFSGERAPAGSLLGLPYYDGLPEDYRQLTGGELRSDIARALATGSNFYEGPCNQLIAKRFRNNYVARIAAWCKQRNMVLTGHLMDENCAARGVLRNGHPLEVLSAFTLPGIDDIFTPCHAGQVEYLTLGSAMYAADRQKNGALAELFALGPCDMELDRMIRQFWLCAAFGIDHYVMAVSPLTAQGNALKPNYYLPFTETQPWFPCFRELGQEAARAASFAGKKRRSRIAVRYDYAPQLVSDLVNYLSRNQYSWELLMPDEASDAEVVLALKNNEIIEEKSGSHFGDFSLLDYYFLREAPRKTAVLEENGSLADGIFLREYADDTLLLINLTDNDRRLRLRHLGKTQEVFLFRRGVLVVDGSPMDNKPYGKRTPLPVEDAEVSWEAPHTLRSDFRDGADSFSLSGKIDGLTLAVRRHPDPVQLTLDGKTVVFAKESPALPPGFQELYQVTAPFSLEAGKHTLQLKNGARDYPYLPAAFLLGSFASSPEKLLSPEVNNSASPLYGYAGRFVQKVRVTLPADARYVSSPNQRFAGELFLDGKSCGRRLAHPFRWEIPAECRGKNVVLEMLWFPSCGQLFGVRCFSSPDAGVLLRKFAPANRRATAIPRLFLEQ